MAIITFTLEFIHLLSSLACLEFIVLVVFISLSYFTYFIYNELIYPLLYIAVAACEAALGLRVTVTYVNKKGNEILKIF